MQQALLRQDIQDGFGNDGLKKELEITGFLNTSTLEKQNKPAKKENETVKRLIKKHEDDAIEK